MDQGRKTEIVEECLSDALSDLRREYGQEITFSLNADYLGGKIVIRVDG